MRSAADRRSAPRAVWDMVRGLAALAALAALLVGVPVLALPRLGRPLPDGVPSAGGLVDALVHQGLDLPVVLRAAAAVLWVAWAVFAACVLVEAVAWARRREARSVRGLSGVQRLAANLVATAVLVIPSLPHLARVPASAADLAVARGPAVTVMYQAPTAAGARSTQPVIDSPTPAVGVPKAYVVQRYDCLWHIAEEHLGDPLRWKEIEALTAGVVQPDGRRLGDPNLILPGWTVLLPADAVGLDDASSPPIASPPPPPAHPSPAPAGASAPAAGSATAAPRTEAGASTGGTSMPAPSAATTVPVATSGQATPTTGAAGAPPTTAATPRATAVTSTIATTAAPAPAAQPPKRARANAPAVSPAAAIVGVSGLLGGIFVWRMRREGLAAHRRRRRGHELVQADPATEAVERRVRAIAAVDTVHWVDATLRYATVALAEAGGGGVEGILCVRPGQLGMEVVVDPPATPVGRFGSTDDGRTWTLDPDMELGELQDLAWGQVLVPALCSVGSTPDGPVLVDLEQAGVLAVEGDPARVEGFLAGAALELASAPWANDTAVYLLGGDERLAMRELVEVVTDSAAFVADLDRVTSLVDDEDLGEAASTLAARVAPGNVEGWFPTVVVAHPGTDTDVLAQLAARAQPRQAGLTLVGPGPLPGATWRLILGPDGAAVLEPLGLELDSRIDAEVVDALAGRIAARTERTDLAPVVELVPEQAPAPEPRAPLLDEEPMEGEVRVMGPVEVTWAKGGGDMAATPERARQLAAVVAYLGTHDDHPVPGPRLQEALWPLGDDERDVRSGAVKEGTLRSTMSRVRKALGKDSLGRNHLPSARNGGYALGPRFRCDWRSFRNLVEDARTAPTAEAIELLRQALSKVRGRPFEDAPPAYFAWASDSPLVSDIEVAVAEAAEELGARALEAGMPDIAEWAARQGLLMVPVREDLHRVRLQAAFDAGDPDGIEAAYTEATRAIRVHIDAAEPLQDETERLYQRLRRACRTHGPQRSENARKARATTG
jgi:DNA-binding SARP family transcriptional activator